MEVLTIALNVLATLVQEAFACCRKSWAKTVVLGIDKPDAQLNLNSFEVLQSQKTLTGALFGGLRPKSDVPTLIKGYLDKVALVLFSSLTETVGNSFNHILLICNHCCSSALKMKQVILLELPLSRQLELF